VLIPRDFDENLVKKPRISRAPLPCPRQMDVIPPLATLSQLGNRGNRLQSRRKIPGLLKSTVLMDHQADFRLIEEWAFAEGISLGECEQFRFHRNRKFFE